MNIVRCEEKNPISRSEEQIPELAAVIEARIRSLSVAELAQFIRLEGEYDVIDADEAAALLKIHPITLRKKAVAWGVPHKRLGTEWRFSRKQLLKWMQMQNGIQSASDCHFVRF